MPEPPFEIGLKLTVERSNAVGFDAEDLKQPRWRNELTRVGEFEVGSTRFPVDVVPRRAEVDAALAETFANHPMTNIDALPGAGGGSAEHRNAFVVVEVITMPGLAPIEPGQPYPVADEQVISSNPLVVHGAVWPHAPGSPEEGDAAAALISQIVAELPRGLWRRS